MVHTRLQRIADWSGATVSILCIIHCALTPLIFLSKPIIDAHDPHGHGFWGALDWIFLFLSFGAVWYSASHSSHKVIKRLFWFFWIIFALGLIGEMNEIHEGEWLMYIGSACLIVTHISHYRYCRKCEIEQVTN